MTHNVSNCNVFYRCLFFPQKHKPTEGAAGLHSLGVQTEGGSLHTAILANIFWLRQGFSGKQNRQVNQVFPQLVSGAATSYVQPDILDIPSR